MRSLFRRSNEATNNGSRAAADVEKSEGPREKEGLAPTGASAGELEDIFQKKKLSERETMVIRQNMVQTQDKLLAAGASGDANVDMLSSGRVVNDVVGDDSMVVGKGIMIKGDVDDCATLIVEGYFEGNYRGGFLAVPRGGKYVGMADVRRAEIGGRLHGTLSARTLLEVRSTGKIEGMVRYNDLKMEPGGHMVGDVQQGA